MSSDTLHFLEVLFPVGYLWQVSGSATMHIEWHITSEDMAKVKAIVTQQWHNALVQDRVNRNMAAHKQPVSRAKAWRGIAASLLTTQQRSGPHSSISRFINTRPFPLAYSWCQNQVNLATACRGVLSAFGGIRRSSTIAHELGENWERLESGLWKDLLAQVGRLYQPVSRDIERDVADFVDDQLTGFGPKQARNFLQGLGLTRYEIPIDSRIIKWLNGFGFAVKLDSAALTDRHYYHFLSDGIQELCARSNLFPCVLDAAIFASFDREGWTQKNVGW